MLCYCSDGQYCSKELFKCKDKNCDFYEDETVSIQPVEGNGNDTHGSLVAKAVCKYDHFQIEGAGDLITNQTLVTCCLRKSDDQKVWMPKRGDHKCQDHEL